MIAFFPKLFEQQQHTQRLASDLLLSIYNHLYNVAWLDFRLLDRRFVAKKLSTVEPALRENVDAFLGLLKRKTKFYMILIRIELS